MSCYRLREFLVSINSEAGRQELIKITFALITNDYVAQKFDLNIYNNSIYKQIFTLDSNMPLGILGYLKVKDEITRLKKLIFI